MLAEMCTVPEIEVTEDKIDTELVRLPVGMKVMTFVPRMLTDELPELAVI